MDVLDSNFYDACALLERLLPEAQFVAMDLEFTGLGRARPSHLDTPSRRYATARDDAVPYPPLQFGLVIFRRTPVSSSSIPAYSSIHNNDSINKDDNINNINNSTTSDATATDSSTRWQAIPFNFNLYPRAVYYPEKARFPFLDRSLILQASTVHFLMGHGFDFMRCFEVGVSWLRTDEAAQFREHVAEHRRARRSPPRRAEPPNPEDAAAVAKVRAVVGDWFSHPPPPDSDGHRIKLFDLPRGAVPRRLVFDMMRDTFPTTVASSIGTHAGVKLRVEAFQSAEEAKARRDGDETAIIDDIVDRAVGFRIVVDMLQKAKTTLVVHHGLMDVTKLYANFVGKLPSTVPDFKHAFKNAFPSIVDTRWGLDYLCARDRQVATVLGREPTVWTRPSNARRNENSSGQLTPDSACLGSNELHAPNTATLSQRNGDASGGPQPMQIVDPSEGNESCMQVKTQDQSTSNPTKSPPSVVASPTLIPLSNNSKVPLPMSLKKGMETSTGKLSEKQDIGRKSEVQRKRNNGRGAPTGPAFWGGGGSGGIKELGNVKEALLEHARNVGLGERVAVDTFVPTEIPDEPGLPNGFIIHEGSTRWDRSADRFAFGRYCVDGMRNGFQHEAGFDALETGKLLILLRELGAAVHVTDHMMNKIFLGTCGGFKAIDLDGGEEEHNEWFAREAVVISGELPADGHEHRFRAALRRITDGTSFDSERSEYFTVDKNSFVGVLARREDDADEDNSAGGKRRLEDSMEDDSGLGSVIRNAQNIGLTATRYDREFLASRWKCDEDEEVKRRRID